MRRITVIGLVVILLLIPFIGLNCNFDRDNDNEDNTAIRRYNNGLYLFLQ